MTKRLYKIEKDAKVFGVCEGLGEYFNIDPSIIRLIFVASLFFAGTGFVVYIVLGIVLPDKLEIEQHMQQDEEIYDNYDDYGDY